MFKKIKEFIVAFEDAYNTVNVNKNNARKAIDDFKKDVDYIVHVSDSLKIIFERLEAIYYYFPIKERRDFIQKTLDLLRYGIKDDNGSFKDFCGFMKLYISTANGAKNNLAHLNELYKESKYDEVMSLAEEYNKKLKEFYVLYGIKEKTTEENE